MITTEIVFDRKKVATKEKPGTIELRVTVNRKSQYISTGVRVLKHQWKNGQIVNCIECEEKMRRVRAIQKRLEAEVADCIEEGRPLDLQACRDSLLDGTVKSSMWDWMRETLNGYRYSRATMDHYWNTMLKLEEFGKMRRWSDCTVENLYEWDNYLHELTIPLTKAEKQRVKAGEKIEPRKITDAGVHNYHKCLKALLNRAFEVGKLQQNPYTRVKGKFKNGAKENPEYLTEDEMMNILNLCVADKRIMEAKDLFVFQMFTGMAYTDASHFNIDNYKQVDGKWIARQERIKSGVPYVSVLLPPVVDVLERYGMQPPHINAQEYNERLKTVGLLAGIKIKLHSHLARHSFGTFMLSKGVKIENLAKMMGHTNITQTQRYAKVLAKDVREEFEMVEKELNKK